MKHARLVSLSTLGLAATVAVGCAAPEGLDARIHASGLDESRLATLVGNSAPFTDAVHTIRPLDDDFVLEHMQLVLKRSADREAALEAHIDALHDKTSPQYQQWLTIEDFASLYGVPEAEIDKITGWLKAHGLRVDSVPPSRMFIEFSGTAAQVREAFHTRIDELEVEGARHIGNPTDPQIPEELTAHVVGIHALHDFMPQPLLRPRGPVKRDGATGTWSMAKPDPDFTTVLSGNTYQAVAPADFATIYNLHPLFAEGLTGAGQTVVVIEDTLIKNASDVASFRAAFGLSGYGGTFTQGTVSGTTTCTNPGVNGAEGEAALDAEWAAASAPGAAIQMAACADTTTVFGGLIALQNLINGASPPSIVSISYGLCESSNGAAANQSYVNTYQQAVALGTSVFVASGDQGAAVCDPNRTTATHGIAVSGFASTPYNVAVGGTDFMDTYNSLTGGPALSTYWSATNSPDFGSALSYIPEIPWNNSCASSLLYTYTGYSHAYFVSTADPGFCNTTQGTNFRTTAAASGGPSTYSKQPTWQTGVIGLPTKSGATNPRYLPDVSLFAANGLWNHFYVYCLTDTAQGGVASCDYTVEADVNSLAAGGTSFSSPALAGIQALINQKMGGPQGNPNPTYYKLAGAEFGAKGNAKCNGSSTTLPDQGCIFNDVTQGDIDVDCSAGSPNCYGASGTRRGILSTSTTSPAPAYNAGKGWDYATGLGTVNAYNLVHAWSQ